MSSPPLDFEPLEPPSGRGSLYIRRARPEAGTSLPDVFVWVSDAKPADGRFPVLYVQDGQTLFEAGRVPFGVAWEMDRCAAQMGDAGVIPPIIVAGVASTAERLSDYAPASILGLLSAETRKMIETRFGGAAGAGRYARMLVETIKPMIDARFPTSLAPADTFVIGASMGGVAAAEVLARYPETFGGLAALSGHFSLLPLDDDPPPSAAVSTEIAQAVNRFVLQGLPRAGAHRIWLDRSEFSLDQHYEPAHRAVEAALTDLGYRSDVDMVSRRYPGVGHNEAAWRDRLHDVLAFLFAR